MTPSSFKEYALAHAEALAAVFQDGSAASGPAQKIAESNLWLMRKLAELEDKDAPPQEDGPALERLKAENDRLNAELKIARADALNRLAEAVDMPRQWLQKVTDAEAEATGHKLALTALAESARALLKAWEGEDASGAASAADDITERLDALVSDGLIPASAAIESYGEPDPPLASQPSPDAFKGDAHGGPTRIVA